MHPVYKMNNLHSELQNTDVENFKRHKYMDRCPMFMN